MEAALDVLSATAEVKPNGIEWEGKERPVSLESPPGAEPIAWCVRGDRGQTIDARRFDRVLGEAAAWRVHERRVPADLPLSTNAGRGHHDEDNKDRRYAFIRLSAALPSWALVYTSIANRDKERNSSCICLDRKTTIPRKMLEAPASRWAMNERKR